MTTQIVSTTTLTALNKLPQDGTNLTIIEPLANSEEIYYYYHLTELGYVKKVCEENHNGVQFCITEKGKMIIQQVQHFNAYTEMINDLYVL